MERLTIPPARGVGSIACDQPRRQSQSLQILLDALQALGRKVDRGQCREFRRKLQQVSGFATGRSACVENPLARARVYQMRGELGRGILHGNPALLESR
jgi:hypothetical protein